MLEKPHEQGTQPEPTRRSGNLVEEFAAKWHPSDLENLYAYLQGQLPASDNTVRDSLAVDFIMVDFQKRWESKVGVKLEAYLEALRDQGGLMADDYLVGRLLYHEFRLRLATGERVSLEEFQRRFPGKTSAIEEFLNDKTELLDTQLGTHYHQGTIAQSNTTPDLSDSALLPAGGGYKPIRRLGHGEFGEVWEAEAPGGVRVALKMIKWHISHDHSQQELQSLELIKQLRHPFLVQVHAYWVQDDRLVIAMELADKTLKDRMEECCRQGHGGIPPEELKQYAAESAEALDFLHGRQLVHRDVKPANILLVSGHAKLADFGLARLIERARLDMTVPLGGTPLFMAPEMWENRCGSRSDQYCLAATYYFLRLNKALFSGHSPFEIMTKTMRDEPDLDPLEPVEKESLRKALAKKADQRHPSCVEFTRALTKTQIAVGAEPRKLPSWPMALAVLALTLTIVFIVFSGSKTRLRAPVEVVINAGESREFTVHLDDLKGDPQNAELEFISSSEWLRFETQPWSNPKTNHVVTAVVDLAAEVKNYEVEMTVRVGEQVLPAKFRLKVLEPIVSLPQGCIPTEDAEIVSVPLDGNRNYWSRVTADGIVFVLLPRDATAGTKTCYLMENMVSNRQYQEFYWQIFGLYCLFWKSECPLSGEWLQGPVIEVEKDGQLVEQNQAALQFLENPVFLVAFESAYFYAKWLHPDGHLPTREQWDKAAGRYEVEPPAAGPFLPEWTEESVTGISIARSMLGPLPVGTARFDVSPFGVRDMAGNGKEWTSSLSASEQVRGPIEERGFVGLHLRSASFRDPRPFTYDAADYQGSEMYLEIQDDIGFRVILEPSLFDSRPRTAFSEL